ncbi:hypothetical protein [Allokutzneria oryzae]|uniref:Zinc-finger n=1 Tax=Allokutzneria oryzae TaxID=1378989 RepID=A0ABV5ZS81_9PSEU
MPIDGSRHAICGETGQTLCGESIVIRPAAETEWITWPTCDKCWQVAKSVLGELKRTRPRLW